MEHSFVQVIIGLSHYLSKETTKRFKMFFILTLWKTVLLKLKEKAVHDLEAEMYLRWLLALQSGLIKYVTFQWMTHFISLVLVLRPELEI